MSNKTDLFQSLGTIAALVISIIALITSIYEASIMKSQQKAMVWPYFQISENYSDQGFAFTTLNNGTGPAIIKSVQVDYKGTPVASLDELLDSLKPDRSFGYNILSNNSLENYVFKPGEERVLFGFPWTDETRELSKGFKNLRMRVQYESVLGEKFLYDTDDGSHERKKFKAKVEFKN